MLRRPKTEDGRWKTEDGRQKTKGKRNKEKGKLFFVELRVNSVALCETKKIPEPIFHCTLNYVNNYVNNYVIIFLLQCRFQSYEFVYGLQLHRSVQDDGYGSQVAERFGCQIAILNRGRKTTCH